MTLAELDRRRAAANEALKVHREALAALDVLDKEVRRVLWMADLDDELSALANRWQDAAGAEEVAEAVLAMRREEAEKALRAWWAQGCRESALEAWSRRIQAGLTDAERQALAERFKKDAP